LQKNAASFKNLTAVENVQGRILEKKFNHQENRNQQKGFLKYTQQHKIHAVSLVVINCTYSFSTGAYKCM